MNQIFLCQKERSCLLLLKFYCMKLNFKYSSAWSFSIYFIDKKFPTLLHASILKDWTDWYHCLQNPINKFQLYGNALQGSNAFFTLTLLNYVNVNQEVHATWTSLSRSHIALLLCACADCNKTLLLKQRAPAVAENRETKLQLHHQYEQIRIWPVHPTSADRRSYYGLIWRGGIWNRPS